MQIFIFLTCALCGVISGVVYDILYIARAFVCGLDKAKFTLKDKIFTCICDLIYFIAFSAMFVFTSICFEFYTIRLYMLVGCALGALIYLKSLHFIIAFLVRKVYNRLRKIKSARGEKQWAKKNATK
ncbi:MAG: spore cortex biosynthesis protein YabQ [Clostridia bacterium]|nr:spore cortex biosynthesis protein YabQ [Clostridia bacterium]